MESFIHRTKRGKNLFPKAEKKFAGSRCLNKRKRGYEESMGDYKVRYKNAKFSNQKIELDGKSFIHCEFQGCMILLERGETEVSGCTLKNCKLMLKGNAYTVGKIIKLFTGKSPLKVLDMEEPLFEKGEGPFQKSMISGGQAAEWTTKKIQG
ncbi:MAG TPA: hypothetical protein VLZ03_09460 [Thermodesulfobacteriota bacterium]|nr:hypothetical protein [Thermodesulfobacteriota bacterium]